MSGHQYQGVPASSEKEGSLFMPHKEAAQRRSLPQKKKIFSQRELKSHLSNQPD